MLRLAADENFNADIVRGLRRRFPDLDLVRIQDVGLSGADDPTVLAWAALEQRVLLTHDVATLVGLALERVIDGHAMPGVVAVSSRAPLGAAIEDLALSAQCSGDHEWEGRVLFLPS
jgi:hypothetical protein